MSPAPTKPPAHHPSQTDKHRHPLIPAKRWARRPLLKFQYGKYPHAFAILALLTSAILLLAAWVSTAFIGSQSPSNSLADAPWLFLVHKPFSVDGKPLDDAAVKAIPRYGISAFKICRWSMLPQDLLANGTCVGAPWVMKGSLEGIDGGEPLGLSTAMSDVLPKLTHVLLIMALLNLAHVYLLIVKAWRVPVCHILLRTEQYPIAHGQKVDADEYTGPISSKCQNAKHRKAQAWYTRLRSFHPRDAFIPYTFKLFLLLFLAPVLIAAAYSPAQEGELEVETGMGAIFLILGVILQSLAWVVSWAFGLKVWMGREEEGNRSYFSTKGGSSGNTVYDH